LAPILGLPRYFLSATRIKLINFQQVKSLPMVRYAPPFNPLGGHDNAGTAACQCKSPMHGT
jgi:hypothetical protein